MRSYRVFFAFLVGLGPVISGIAACGDDATPGSAGSNATSDSGPVTPPGSTSDGAAVDITAAAVGSTVYLGHAASLDGSGSTGPANFTYAWTLKSAPAGSTVATASLNGAATAKPTFSPDKIGNYIFTLTTASGGATSTADATVNVVDPPIFYLTEDSDGGPSATVSLIGPSGDSTPKPVNCFANDAGQFYGTSSIAQMNSDFWEAPAGEPSKTVFILDDVDAGTAVSSLYAATSADTCASPRKILDSAGLAYSSPKISPDGKRVVYMRDIGVNGPHVATIGLDGSNPRDLANFLGDGDGGQSDAAINTIPTRPVWVNPTTVAWVQEYRDGWQVLTVSDDGTASPGVLMRCAGLVPSQFDILANGNIIAKVFNGGSAGFQTRSNIVVYANAGQTIQCGSTLAITELGDASGGTGAQDFSLSPDKAYVAFLQSTSAGGSQIMIAKTDGTGDPVPASTNTNVGRGPRWVGGGMFLSWATSASDFDAGNGTTIAAVSVDGGATRLLVQSTPTGSVDSMGNCAIGRGVGSGVTAVGIGGLFVLHIVRRRRRRQNS